MVEVKNKISQKKRATVSILLFVMFILMPISGKMISINRTDIGISHIWSGIHYLIGMIFTIVGIFHIIYNWKSMKKYFGKK